MKRLAVALSILFTALLLGFAGAAQSGGPPGTGCPTGFQIAPVSILGSNFTGVADNVNHDGLICIRVLPVPEQANAFGIFTDNTVG